MSTPFKYFFQKSTSFERKEGHSFEGGALSSIGTLSSKYGMQIYNYKVKKGQLDNKVPLTSGELKEKM